MTNKLEDNWIEKVFSFGAKRRIPKLLFSAIFFIIPFVVFLPFIFTRLGVLLQLDSRTYFSIICAAAWCWIGPYLITRYCSTLNNMLNDLNNNHLLTDDDKNTVTGFHRHMFRFGFLHIPVIALAVIALVLDDMKYSSRFLLDGFQDPYFYLFIFFLAYLSYFMGIGIKGVYFGMKSVFYLAPKNSDRVSIDYFHEDGSGGLGGMKQFIVKMTILFSTGIMFYPVVLDMALVTDNVYTKVFLYSTIIGVSLLALTSGALSLNRLYRYAQKKKRGTLRVYSLKYKALMEHSIEKGQDFSFEDLNAINYYLAINIIRSTMSIKIRTEVIVETVSAILVPTLALLVNINYVSYILSILFYG